MGYLGRYEHEVALSDQQLNLINSSVLDESVQVAQEVGYSVANTRFLTDAVISGKKIAGCHSRRERCEQSRNTSGRVPYSFRCP